MRAMLVMARAANAARSSSGGTTRQQDSSMWGSLEGAVPSAPGRGAAVRTPPTTPPLLSGADGAAPSRSVTGLLLGLPPLTARGECFATRRQQVRHPSVVRRRVRRQILERRIRRQRTLQRCDARAFCAHLSEAISSQRAAAAGDVARVDRLRALKGGERVVEQAVALVDQAEVVEEHVVVGRRCGGERELLTRSPPVVV